MHTGGHRVRCLCFQSHRPLPRGWIPTGSDGNGNDGSVGFLDLHRHGFTEVEENIAAQFGVIRQLPAVESQNGVADDDSRCLCRRTW